jgi:nitronate monooxygenase
MWRDRRFIDLVGLEHPVVAAPMAGPGTPELAVAVTRAGGLGSLPCAMLTAAETRAQLEFIRQQTNGPVNANFFCHAPPEPDVAREKAWRARMGPYYAEFGLDPDAPFTDATRRPFDESMCRLMEELRPRVVSFHFGLPGDDLCRRLKNAGCLIIGTATTVREARWLEQRGVDGIIAQGVEAGGHRGMFLTENVATQVGTLALVPQVVDAVAVPVIAAGGIGDGRGVAAALTLGASAAMLGTAFLFCPECRISPAFRKALLDGQDDSTALTNVLTGRAARGIVNRVMRDLGPFSADAPRFPQAAAALAPLRAKAEAQGCGDFSPLWSGQAARLGRDMPAGDLTRTLACEAATMLGIAGEARANRGRQPAAAG